jgi:hypothetical protein
MTLTGSNVGIGTSTPNAPLQVASATGTNVNPAVNITNTTLNGYGVLRLTGNSRGGFIDFYDNTSAQASIVGQGGAFYIYTNGDSSGTPKVTIASNGAATFSSNISAGGNINGGSFSMNFGSSFNFGTGFLKSSTNGITVTTSTTTIYSSTNIGSVLSGNLVLVTGVVAGNGVNFTDLILYMNSGTFSVISSQTFGSPPARTYSVSNENLRLSMASGTYVVACVALIQGYTNP